MLPYWLMFILWTAGAVQTERRPNHDARKLFFVAAACITALMIGLRFEVGGDWSAYQRIYEDLYFLSFQQALGTTDAGYAAVNWIAMQLGFGIPLVNTVCAMLFVGGLGWFAWKQPNPALAMLVAVPYLIIVVAMGYTRQAAAIGIVCVALADPDGSRHPFRIVAIVAIAALFHKTAILILPLLLFPILTRNFFLGAVGVLAFLVVFTLVLGGDADRLVANYVDSNYDSQGAAIRVSMNVLAAAVFLMLRRRFSMSEYQKEVWTYASLLAVISVAALFSFSASSGIDRLSLFLIPLQVMALSRLPDVLSGTGRAQISTTLAVIGYSFAIQFVWLNYATNASYWLPYKNVMFQ